MTVSELERAKIVCYYKRVKGIANVKTILLYRKMTIYYVNNMRNLITYKFIAFDRRVNGFNPVLAT